MSKVERVSEVDPMVVVGPEEDYGDQERKEREKVRDQFAERERKTKEEEKIVIKPANLKKSGAAELTVEGPEDEEDLGDQDPQKRDKVRDEFAERQRKTKEEEKIIIKPANVSLRDKEAEEKAKKEKERKAAIAKAMEEQEAKEAAEKAKKEQEAAEAAAKAKKEQEAAEAAAKAKKEQEAKEAAAKAKKEQEAKEAAAKAKKEQEAAEAAAKAKKEQEAQEAAAKAKKEQEAKEAAAKAKKEQEAKESAAKAKKEQEEKEQEEEAARAQREKVRDEFAERQRKTKEDEKILITPADLSTRGRKELIEEDDFEMTEDNECFQEVSSGDSDSKVQDVVKHLLQVNSYIFHFLLTFDAFSSVRIAPSPFSLICTGFKEKRMHGVLF